MGVYFSKQQDLKKAKKYFAQAEALDPNNWNIHRQDWALTDKKAQNRNWLMKVTDRRSRIMAAGLAKIASCRRRRVVLPAAKRSAPRSSPATITDRQSGRPGIRAATQP